MSLLLMFFGTQLSTLPPSLAVSKPSVLMSHSQMTKYQVGYPDAALVAVKDDAGYRFWMDGGNGLIDGIPGRPWSFMKGGKRLDEGSTELVTGNVSYWETYKCPTFDNNVTYKAPCVNDADDWHGGKALQWIGNVYKDPGSDGILGFIHMEFTDPRADAEMCYFRFGLGWSTNGGANFNWLGYLVEPEVTYEHSMFGFKYG
eukprot:gene10044-22020_t